MKRYCLACGAELVRAPQTSERDWLRRKVCGRQCASMLARRPVEDLPVSLDRRPDPSRELLKRLLRYGLRHDGLPGLPAPTLIARADELGVRS